MTHTFTIKEAKRIWQVFTEDHCPRCPDCNKYLVVSTQLENYADGKLGLFEFTCTKCNCSCEYGGIATSLPEDCVRRF